MSKKRIIPKKTCMDHGISVCGVLGVFRDVGGYGR